jgi:hypothetical protein
MDLTTSKQKEGTVHHRSTPSQVLPKRGTPVEIMVEVRWKGICRNKEDGVRRSPCVIRKASPCNPGRCSNIIDHHNVKAEELSAFRKTTKRRREGETMEEGWESCQTTRDNQKDVCC